MSLEIHIYHSSVKEMVEQGFKIDEFEHPAILKHDMKRFLDRLLLYGYQLEFDDEEKKEFIKIVSNCPVQVSLTSSQIAFLVPSWDDSENAFFEALEDASELTDSKNLILYLPKTGAWIFAK